MDLSFVVAALRRYVWIVVVVTVAGVAVAATAGLWTGDDYESSAVLSVRPPSGGGSFVPDADRYITTQLSVLGSDSLARSVRDDLRSSRNVEISIVELSRVVRIETEPQTDLVSIVVTTDSPATSAAIAQSYVDVYMASLPTSNLDEEQLAELRADAAELQDELDELDERIRTAMEPFLPEEGDPADIAIPTPEMVDPSATSRRALVQSRLEQTASTILSLEVESRIRTNTAVVSDASEPFDSVPRTVELLPAAVILASLFVGVGAALAWARLSPRVLDAAEVESILGAQVVASLDRDPALDRDASAVVEEVPPTAWAAVDLVCVSAETEARRDGPLTVAVAGARPAAGVTTLAAAMAGRFAARGSSVMLLDASGDDALSSRAPEREGALVTVDGDAGRSDQRSGSPTRAPDVDGVRIVDVASWSDGAPMRAGRVAQLLADLCDRADIVVVDCGPLLASAVSTRFAEHADAVVVAVPLARQDTSSLERVSRLLARDQSVVLPVLTDPPRRPRGAGAAG